jgi:hypothetical protein
MIDSDEDLEVGSSWISVGSLLKAGDIKNAYRKQDPEPQAPNS